MFDNEAGACPQCGNGAMPQSPNTSAPENKGKEKKLGNLFNNFKKKKSSRDVSTKEAISDTNDTLAIPKAPIFNSTEQNIEENTDKKQREYDKAIELEIAKIRELKREVEVVIPEI